jgi:hypothetical protein
VWSLLNSSGGQDLFLSLTVLVSVLYAAIKEAPGLWWLFILPCPAYLFLNEYIGYVFLIEKFQTILTVRAAKKSSERKKSRHIIIEKQLSICTTVLQMSKLSKLLGENITKQVQIILICYFIVIYIFSSICRTVVIISQI